MVDGVRASVGSPSSRSSSVSQSGPREQLELIRRRHGPRVPDGAARDVSSSLAWHPPCNGATSARGGVGVCCRSFSRSQTLSCVAARFRILPCRVPCRRLHHLVERAGDEFAKASAVNHLARATPCWLRRRRRVISRGLLPSCWAEHDGTAYVCRTSKRFGPAVRRPAQSPGFGFPRVAEASRPAGRPRAPKHARASEPRHSKRLHGVPE
jgi:hypothetical protein